MLDTWREMIAQAQLPGPNGPPARALGVPSWGSSPNIELLRTLLADTASPG
jgi:hypothetical protein